MDNRVPRFKLAIKDGGKIKVGSVSVVTTSEVFFAICKPSEVKVMVNVDTKGFCMPVVLHVPSSQCFSARRINLGTSKDKGL